MTVEDFKKQFLPYHPKLYRIALNLLNNEDDAKDIIQDTYYKLWKSRDKLEQVNNYEAFSITVVKNLCLDLIKSPKRNRSNKENIDNLNKVYTKTTFDDNIDFRNKVVEAKILITKLPENQKQVITLRVINDYSLEEIEKITGLSSVNVRVLLSRARKTIKEELNKKYNLVGNGI